MTDTTHLTALFTRLGNEKGYIRAAKSEGEIELRSVWVKQIQNEINAEEKFLGMSQTDWNASEISDEELMAELGL